MHLVSQLLRKPPVPTQRAASRTIKQYARNAKAVPITTAEFYEHLLRCMPPTGWGHSLVVANSGGPDSVCLLHLLAAVVKERGQTAAVHPGSKNNFPYRIYSLHINHRLQAANTDMQTTALHTAAMHHVRPVVESIPWGKGPFPPLPGKDQPMEEVTRKARAALIHLTMRRLNFNCIAYAHHADDQVETSIMRLLMGSKQWGASAMKPVRRWGMGDSSDICPAGSWGMNTWIIRPLLDVPKDRILATCEANNLEYVVDPTNFQPEITLRNHVRDYLARREAALVDANKASSKARTSEAELDQAIRHLAPGSPRLRDLREAVRRIGQDVERLEMRATNALQRCRLPSPPSTVMLSPRQLRHVTDPDVRLAIVRRILRYVSPKPWGSLAAIAHARQSNLQEIAARIWDDSNLPRTAFSQGGEVLWRPLAQTVRGRIGLYPPKDKSEGLLWLAQRAPPSGRSSDSTVRDVTNDIRNAVAQGQTTYTTLYDNRFLVEFGKTSVGMPLIPAWDEGKVVIRSSKSFMLPEVVLQRPEQEDEVLGLYTTPKSLAVRQPAHGIAAVWRSRAGIESSCIRTLAML